MKFANSDTRVSYFVLFGIQAAVESAKVSLEMNGEEYINEVYRAVSVFDTGNSFESAFRAWLLVALFCAGGPEVFSMKGISSGGGGTTRPSL